MFPKLPRTYKTHCRAETSGQAGASGTERINPFHGSASTRIPFSNSYREDNRGQVCNLYANSAAACLIFRKKQPSPLLSGQYNHRGKRRMTMFGLTYQKHTETRCMRFMLRCARVRQRLVCQQQMELFVVGMRDHRNALAHAAGRAILHRNSQCGQRWKLRKVVGDKHSAWGITSRTHDCGKVQLLPLGRSPGRLARTIA